MLKQTKDTSEQVDTALIKNNIFSLEYPYRLSHNLCATWRNGWPSGGC